MPEYAPLSRSYELMIILSPDVPEDELSPALEEIAGYIRAVDGTLFEVLRDAPWGRRRLAYSIRHGGRDVRDGFYTVFHFDLLPSRVSDVEREIKLNERIMRWMLVIDPAEIGERPEAVQEGDLLRKPEPVAAETPAAATGDGAPPSTGESPGEAAIANVAAAEGATTSSEATTTQERPAADETVAAVSAPEAASPWVDSPVPEATTADTEAPVTEEPAVEEPAVETPVAEEPASEAPATDGPVADDATTGETKEA